MKLEEFLKNIETKKALGLGNWSYKITDPTHPHYGETLWSGRYCAVVAFIFMKSSSTGKYYILANKRGFGTPDFQGMWNCPCGFMEAYESGQEACTRETLEETGLYIDPSKFHQLGQAETEPEKCNKAHVTIRYIVTLDDSDFDPVHNIEDPANLEGGELDEVEEIKWISLDSIEKYNWAFGHLSIISNIRQNYEQSGIFK